MGTQAVDDVEKTTSLWLAEKIIIQNMKINIKSQIVRNILFLDTFGKHNISFITFMEGVNYGNFRNSIASIMFL